MQARDWSVNCSRDPVPRVIWAFGLQSVTSLPFSILIVARIAIGSAPRFRPSIQCPRGRFSAVMFGSGGVGGVRSPLSERTKIFLDTALNCLFKSLVSGEQGIWLFDARTTIRLVLSRALTLPKTSNGGSVPVSQDSDFITFLR